jgi:hypothetical protein
MRRFALLAGIALLTACGNMLNPEGRTAGPTPSPLPSGVANINPSEEQLAPGRYTRHDFAPRVTFEVDGPWYSANVIRGFFDIQQEPDVDEPAGPPESGSADVIAIQFARPDALYGEGGGAEPADAADAVAILETNPDLIVVETSSSRMGGLDGSQITIENAGTGTPNVMDLPPGTIGLNPERRMWIAFFDTDDGLLAIMVGGSIARWDETLAAAEPVLESVEIGQ